MDVLDQTDGHFLYCHFPDALRHAGLGAGIADHRTSRFFDDSDDPGNEIFFGVAGQCLHPSRVAWTHRFVALVCHAHICSMGDSRHALGVILIEDRKLKIEDCAT